MGIRILIPRRRRSGGGLKTSKFLWVAVGVALWGTAYTIFGAGGMAGVLRARADVTRMEQEVVRAREANARLEEQIEAIREDPAAIERVAREDLFLAKPGEKVYLLPPLPEAQEPLNAAAEARPGDLLSEVPGQ